MLSYDVFMNYLQFDSEDPYSILLYGTGALTALWFASAIVGAIDSIPIVRVVIFVLEVGVCWSCENCLSSYS